MDKNKLDKKFKSTEDHRQFSMWVHECLDNECNSIYSATIDCIPDTILVISDVLRKEIADMQRLGDA